MIEGLLSLIIYLLIVGLLVWLVWYIADHVPLPDPFNRLVKIVAVIIGVIIVIMVLLQLAGGLHTGLPRLG